MFLIILRREVRSSPAVRTPDSTYPSSVQVVPFLRKVWECLVLHIYVPANPLTVPFGDRFCSHRYAPAKKTTYCCCEAGGAVGARTAEARTAGSRTGAAATARAGAAQHLAATDGVARSAARSATAARAGTTEAATAGTRPADYVDAPSRADAFATADSAKAAATASSTCVCAVCGAGRVAVAAAAARDATQS